MIPEQETPFTIYTKNFASKFSAAINLLTAKNSQESVDMIMSKELETVFYNADFKAAFTTGSLKVSFFENIIIPKYDLEKVNEIILISSNQESEIKKFLDFLNSFAECHSDKKIKLYFMVYPQQTGLTQMLIKNLSSNALKQMSENIKIQNFNFDFYPFDEDLFSLEYSSCLSEILVSNEKTGLNLSAEAIYKLQILFGTFPDIYYWGKYAEEVLDIFQEIESENKNNSFPDSTIFPNLILIDRSVDFLSSLLSQFSYLGMLDEVFSINKGAIHVPKSVLDPNSISNDMTYYHIRSKENILPKIQNEDYNTMLQIIKTEVESLEDIKPIENLRLEMEKALKQIETEKTKNAIRFHLRLREKIQTGLFSSINVELNLLQDDILRNGEKLIERLIEFVQIRVPIERIYRLVFIYNICQEGFLPEKYDELVKEILEAYGPERLKELFIFDRAGLFVRKKDPSGNFSIIEANNYKKLKCILTEPYSDSNKSTHPYYYYRLFNENVPIMVKCVADFISGTDKNGVIKEWVRKSSVKEENRLAGFNSEIIQTEKSMTKIQVGDKINQYLEGLTKHNSLGENVFKKIPVESSGGRMFQKTILEDKNRKSRLKEGNCLLFVVGGITYSEVCSVRKIAEQMGRNIHICTTSIITNDSFINQVTK